MRMSSAFWNGSLSHWDGGCRPSVVMVMKSQPLPDDMLKASDVITNKVTTHLPRYAAMLWSGITLSFRLGLRVCDELLPRFPAILNGRLLAEPPPLRCYLRRFGWLIVRASCSAPAPALL